eukprot:6211448-Pleurochrysis_carterae.AAC.5
MVLVLNGQHAAYKLAAHTHATHTHQECISVHGMARSSFRSPHGKSGNDDHILCSIASQILRSNHLVG